MRIARARQKAPGASREDKILAGTRTPAKTFFFGLVSGKQGDPNKAKNERGTISGEEMIKLRSGCNPTHRNY